MQVSILITGFIFRSFVSFTSGYIYIEPRRAANAMVHIDQAYEVYKSWSTPRKYVPNKPILKMRQFLFLMKVNSLL